MQRHRTNLSAVIVDHTQTNKCASCKGATCCTYVTQQIAAPRTKLDFSNLLWQVSHRGVHVFRDEGVWYLLFEGRCDHLQADGRCAIYETRPDACRDHSNDGCEFDAPREESLDLYFQTYEELLEYCKKRFKNWDKPNSGKSKP